MIEHQCSLKTGITRTREFERKRLATHAANGGLKCGYGCIYCRVNMLRFRKHFKRKAVQHLSMVQARLMWL